MIFAVWRLEAGELTVGAERFLVKPMAVGVKLIFGKIRVEFDMVFWVILANRGGFLPSFGFDFETLNI